MQKLVLQKLVRPKLVLLKLVLQDNTMLFPFLCCFSSMTATRIRLTCDSELLLED